MLAWDMFEKFDRREFLGLTAGAAAAGMAGCTSNDSEGTDTESGSPAGTAEPTETPDTGGYMNGVGSDASVSFDVPSDGTTLNSPYVQWKGAASGVTIEESGPVNDGAGHYHVMVDTDPVTPGETIPGDSDQHIHYGTGQEDGVLELEPGDHTLHLQVGDGDPTAMGLTDTVEVTVEDTASLDLSTTVDGSVVEWDVSAENYTIESSGEINANAGHLHAVIDTEHVPVGDVIPGDSDQHIHYGGGSTSGTIDLAEQLGEAYEAGEHKIHFQVGTGTHRATMVHAHTTVTTE